MLWLFLSVLIWGVVHTVLASQQGKNWFQQRWGQEFMRFYRLAYNLFSLVSFLPVLWLMAVLPDKILYQVSPPWLYLMIIGQLTAALLLVIGVMQTDTLAFVGLRQLFDRREETSELVTHGLYRWVRHPLYTAGLLFIWLTPIMTRNTLIVFAALSLYIVVGAFFEERKLQREFGGAYQQYRAVTPMLIPGLIFIRKK